MEDQIKNSSEYTQVVDIQFRSGQKVYYFDPAGVSCKAGDHVIIDTARGAEYGVCTAGNHCITKAEVVAPLRPVLRIANEQDEKIAAANRETEQRAFEICAKKILEYQLDMQLVSAECAFDGSKILFFFTADERVDFRELVKVLANTFHTRIELRQIGVRDKAKMVGGLGICGRPFCCSSFLDDFQPVSIKMAKTQNLSLNPTKISGTCGRLMCCLKYEQDAYEDLLRTSPKAESLVDTPDGRGTVVELDLLRQRVKVRMEEHPEVTGTYANAEIAILRNGKAKKNDTPIPADLAPISGTAKHVYKLADKNKEDRLFLDPIKFRYSTEKIIDEPEEEKIPVGVTESTEEKPSRSGRSRRRRPKRPKTEQTGAADKAKKDTPPANSQNKNSEPEKAKKAHRKPYHHRRPKPSSNQKSG